MELLLRPEGRSWMTIEAPNHIVDVTRWKVLAGQRLHVDSLLRSESTMEEESGNIDQI